ncbi:hypothetical protein BJX70DRAFT_134206 [Aspergillus crustosus]
MGHFAKDCPQAGAPRTCRNCGSEDHIAKECDKPRDLSTVTCRNCDEIGHFSRDCTKKKDWSRVQCSNCQEMGHTIRRCPQAESADASGGGGDFNAGTNGNSGGDAAWDNTGNSTQAEETPVADGGWEGGGGGSSW